MCIKNNHIEMSTQKCGQYDYYRRLQHLSNSEVNIVLRETALAKRSARFHKKLDEAMKLAKQQQCDYAHIQSTVQQRRNDSEARSQVLEMVRVQLEEAKQCNEQMRQQLQERSGENAASQRHNNQFLRTLKEATGTYINHKALPHRIQGVVLSVRDNNTQQLEPFNFAANDEQSLSSFWLQLQKNNPKSRHWPELLSGVQPSDAEKQENNENLTPVIDLTSSSIMDNKA